MSRNIDFLFSPIIENDPERQNKEAFKENIKSFYQKSYKSKNVALYTPYTAGFLVSVLGIAQKVVDSNSEANNILNIFVIAIPVVAAFVVGVTSQMSTKSDTQLKLAVTEGVRNGFFFREIDLENQTAIADEENRIEYQLGLSPSASVS